MRRPKGDFPVLVLLFLALTAAPLSAQRGWGGGGLGLYGFGPRLGENIDLALELKDDLGLTPEQIGALQELDRGVQAEVEPLDAEIQLLRNRILAGEVAGSQGLLQLERLQEDFQLAAEPYRVEVVSILTPEQHRLLQAAMFETRPGLGRGARQGYVGAGVAPRAVSGRLGFGGRGAVGLRGGPGIGYGGGPGVGYGAGYGIGYRAGLGRGRGLGPAARGYGRGFVRGGRGPIRW